MAERFAATETAGGARPRLGVSACLAGEPVRYDGGDKRVAFLVERLAREVELVPVCPEAELGLGVPREPIHLVAAPGAAQPPARDGERAAGAPPVERADVGPPGPPRTARDERETVDRADSIAARLPGAGAGRPEATRPARDPGGSADLGDAGAVRLVGVASGVEHTGAMRAFAARRVGALGALDGYLLKARSPSCALRDAPVDGGAPGSGLFARVLAAHRPGLVLADESDLAELARREHLLVRLFAAARLRALVDAGLGPGALVRFHTVEKMLVLAHHEPSYRALGRLVARAAELPPDDLAARYRRLHADALAHPATRGARVNVLQHLAGWLRDRLDAAARAELAALVAACANGHASPATVAAALRAHALRVGHPGVAAQTVLAPYPAALDDTR